MHHHHYSHSGSVWIQLKTEKHCNKIIFRYVNSIVESIFNEKVDKKWYLWVCKQCTNALFTIEKVSLYCWKQKKKKSCNMFCAQTWTQNAQTKHTLSVFSFKLLFQPLSSLIFIQPPKKKKNHSLLFLCSCFIMGASFAIHVLFLPWFFVITFSLLQSRVKCFLLWKREKRTS